MAAPDKTAHIDEAEDYVNSVMSSQGATLIETVTETTSSSNRKRQLSSESDRGTTKKSKCDDIVEIIDERDIAPVPKPRSGKVIMHAAEIHTSADVSVHAVLKKMSADMAMMFQSLTERMDALETNLERRLTSKIANIIDKRVNVEMKQVKKHVDERLDTIRADITTDIETLTTRLDTMQQSASAANGTEDTNRLKLQIVIRNLMAHDNENITSKVEALIRDGLRLRDVMISSAERKPSDNRGHAGVVIVTFATFSDKQNVMAVKAQLKHSSQYKRVFIHHDQTREERLMVSNLRVIVDAVRNNKSDISVVGSRVVTSERRDRGDRDGRGDRVDRGNRSDHMDRGDRENRGDRDNRGGRGNRMARGEHERHMADRPQWPNNPSDRSTRGMRDNGDSTGSRRNYRQQQESAVRRDNSATHSAQNHSRR